MTLEDDDSIECQEHGVRARTFVCQHLVSGSDLGFHFEVSEDEPDIAWPDAWCDACDAVLEAEGGWTEEAEEAAGVSVVCDFCYESSRERNFRENEVGFAKLLDDALLYLAERQAEISETFGLGECDRFDWNQGTGQLVFSTRGERSVVGDIVFVGSTAERSGTWLWSWANDSFLEPLREPMLAIRRHGLEHGMLKLASARWPGGEPEGWQMTAIAAYLLGARGAYRTPSERGATFMLLTSIGWAQ